MRKALKIIGIILGTVVLAVAGIGSYVHYALPNVGPAPEISVESTPAMVARGEYLANNVMVCMDCHSTRDWSLLSAPPVAGTLGKGGDKFDRTMGFPGEFYAANITPAGIGDWTDGEIFRAITTGVRKNGRPIFPVMPHKNYGQLDENDIKSVIAYLRTLPAIAHQVPESEADFPMNFILNTIPSKASLAPMPAKSDAVAYGKYMVTAAACFDCHTPFEEGKYNEAFSFAGGRSFALPSGVITSANLTPDPESGIGKWTKQDFISRFAMYRDSTQSHKQVNFMKEFNTIMPWVMYSGMTDEDLGAIYAFLRTVNPVNNKVVKFQAHTAKR